MTLTKTTSVSVGERYLNGWIEGCREASCDGCSGERAFEEEEVLSSREAPVEVRGQSHARPLERLTTQCWRWPSEARILLSVGAKETCCYLLRVEEEEAPDAEVRDHLLQPCG